MRARVTSLRVVNGCESFTIDLDPNELAGLRRFAEKISHEQAYSVLYGHVKPDIRSAQAADIIAAFAKLDKALADAGVASWPWIETGRP